MRINCVIIDDEHLARQYLKDYVNKVPFLNLLGDFNSPLKALAVLKNNPVHLMFLDIEMPDISGIEFLKSLEQKPQVIFTTAYQEYAIEGYELNVTDYLLKPFSFERFLKSVNKVAESMQQKKAANHGEISEIPGPEKDYLVIRADRKLYKINYDDVVYIEGQKAYVTFHTLTGRITALATLKSLQDTLPTNRFIRIHKSFIVSVDRIRSLEGNMIEVGKKILPVGKNYQKSLSNVFGPQNRPDGKFE